MYFIYFLVIFTVFKNVLSVFLDTPICKHNERIVLVGASKDETVEISCEIQADPPPK